MITTFRTITAAGAAALALAGGAALTGTSAQADGGAHRLPPRPEARSLVSSCSGGQEISMSRRATDYQGLAAGAAAEVEGSQLQVKGPTKGTDTVLVTLYAMSYSGGSSVQLYRDGVGTSEGSKYLAYGTTLDQGAVQFCTKIGKGQHTLSLKVTDTGGSGTTLYYPTVTYQRFS
ncbi:MULTISPECIES: hypothetical protein [unclassified Nocardioides]|jgi:hypothetical protein|uniref:hypothetical protein n=1 Tax=Nocardioides sp. URHA0032 TaxID=1380388 RepID=UPI00048B7645|nr:hypothetical protein [Nocardioides sp. URHA0032]